VTYKSYQGIEHMRLPDRDTCKAHMIHMDDVDVKVVCVALEGSLFERTIRRLVMHKDADLVSADAEMLLNYLAGILTDAVKQRQMIFGQITKGPDLPRVNNGRKVLQVGFSPSK
jgi:hypothetical protein